MNSGRKCCESEIKQGDTFYVYSSTSKHTKKYIFKERPYPLPSCQNKSAKAHMGFTPGIVFKYFRKIKESSSKNLILQVARLAARGKS